MITLAFTFNLVNKYSYYLGAVNWILQRNPKIPIYCH